MKKTKLFLFAGLFAMSSLVLTSCGEEATGDASEESTTEETTDSNEGKPAESQNTEPEAETTEMVMYQCPDDCGEGRAYFEPGPCKECGKDLKVI